MARQRGSLPRAYLRVDPHIASTHPAVGEFMKLMESAHDQPRRGRWKSRALLNAAVGPTRARHAIDRRDVVQHDGDRDCINPADGTRREFCSEEPHLYLEGWDEWQEGDYTVGDRMTRVRARKKRAKQATLFAPVELNAVQADATPAGTRAAPSGAGMVVAAFVRARTASGGDRHLDRASRDILGAHAKRLLAEGWPLEILIMAVEAKATTQSNPAFLTEWGRIAQADVENAEHQVRKGDERRAAPGILASIADQLRAFGLPADGILAKYGSRS